MTNGVAGFGALFFFNFVENCGYLIYKSKRGVCLSVCVDKNWTVPRRFFQSLHVPCGAGL
jgi:hypothetical protein